MSESDLLVSSLNWTQSKFNDKLAELQDLYYNASLSEAKQIISDVTYDKLINIYESKYGPYIKVGSDVREERKESLPFYMGSLGKAKTTKELDLYLRKYPNDKFVIMDKIDGISAVETSDKFITRGNGKLGTNISRIMKYIGVPKLNNGEYARGEIAITKKLFEQKYKDTMTNSRNMIFGSINSKDSFDPAVIKDLSFLPYRFVDSQVRPQSEQLEILEKKGFIVPWYTLIDHPKSSEDFFKYLTDLLIQRKKIGEFNVDGLVLYANGSYDFPNGEDPKHSIAFKSSDLSEITTVEYVEWNASKLGLLKPRIKIKPVFLDGATIDWVTGHNARFIVDNEIGQDTIVEVIRSGSVIPKIQAVLQHTTADLPKDINYHWNANQVEFVVDDLESPEIAIKKIYSFFKTLGAKFVGEKTVEKLYHNGGFTTLDKFFNASVEDVIKADGFKTAGATRIVEAIQGSIKNVDLATLGSASGTIGIGFGVRRFNAIIEKFPDFLTSELEHKDYVAKLQSIGGFNESAYTFADNIKLFKDFIERYPQITIRSDNPVVNNVVINNNNPIINIQNQPVNPINNNNTTNVQIQQKPSLAGKSIVFTGFSGATGRDLEQRLKLLGAKVLSAVSGKTSILVIKDLNEGKGKLEKVKEINVKNGNTIEIIQLDDFLTKYL